MAEHEGERGRTLAERAGHQYKAWLAAAVIGLLALIAAGTASAETPSPTAPRAPLPTSTVAAAAADQNGPTAIYYTVRRGDSLWLIARRFGVTVDVVAKNNGFDGKKVLREGMRLYLPYSNETGSVRLSGAKPVVKSKGLHFVASIKAQACWLFRDGKLLNRWTCSTGRPGSPSIPGNYTVQSKMPRAYNDAAEFWMPSWLGIYNAGKWENGIHGIPYRSSNGERLWTDLVGTPITYGCVMLEDRLARQLYQMAHIGMPVTILP
jgi:lipoprotein-anchoring transpeptidase ErfK/SrfK